MCTIKLFRFRAILGAAIMSFSFAVVAAAPEIAKVTGNMKEGQLITIDGSNFTAKANAKPLLFWSADGGLNPSLLGRKTAWDGTFNGELVDISKQGAIIAEGSTKALRHDYDLSEGAILARISFDSDELYVWRKRYDDFDRLKDQAIRTRLKNIKTLRGNPQQIVPGMLMSTQDKRLWGPVIKYLNTTDPSVGVAFYSNSQGNLFDVAAKNVPMGEKLYFYTSTDINLSSPIIEAELGEGSGIFKTFNHKIFRLWGKYGVYGNNTYISLDRDGGAISEYTQVSSFWNAGWENPIASATERWVVEEFAYRAGHVDQVDGMLFFWQNRIQGWKSQRFRFTTMAYPHKYSDLYQTQVSNGTQPLSYEYFDSLYVDESWHRVMVCSEATWSKCKQPEVVIPTAWSDNEIKVSLRLGALKNTTNFFFYVVNGLGEVNEKGFASCPLCPLPPSQK